MMKPFLPLASMLVAAALLTGCSGAAVPSPSASLAASSPTPASAPPKGTPAESPSARQSAQADPSGAARVGIDPANPPAALSSGTVPNVAGLSELTVELVGVERRGELLYGVFRFTPKRTSAERWRLSDLVEPIWRPSLVDNVRLKKHLAIDQLTTSPYAVGALPGQSFYASSAWAAPQAGSEVDILVHSSFPQPLRVRVP